MPRSLRHDGDRARRAAPAPAPRVLAASPSPRARGRPDRLRSISAAPQPSCASTSTGCSPSTRSSRSSRCGAACSAAPISRPRQRRSRRTRPRSPRPSARSTATRRSSLSGTSGGRTSATSSTTPSACGPATSPRDGHGAGSGLAVYRTKLQELPRRREPRASTWPRSPRPWTCTPRSSSSSSIECTSGDHAGAYELEREAYPAHVRHRRRPREGDREPIPGSIPGRQGCLQRSRNPSGDARSPARRARLPGRRGDALGR